MSLNTDHLAELENSATPTRAPSLNSAFNGAKRKINFKGVETAPPLWPADKYPFEVTDVETKTSEKSGHEYASVEFTCIGGPYRGKKFPRRVVLMLEGNGLGNTKNFLEASGLMPEDEEWGGSVDDFLQCCVWGKVIQKKETYNGETQLRNSIGFNGFESIAKYPIPDPNDPFADENAPAQIPATVSGFGKGGPTAVTSGSAPVTTGSLSSKPAWG